MPIPSTIITIFGITGDLSRRKLIPAFYNLFLNGCTRESALIGFGRRSFNREDFENLIKASLANVRHPDHSSERLEEFLHVCHFVQGNFDDPASFTNLKNKIHQLDHGSMLRVFYYATAPEFFGPISQYLQEQDLNQNARVILEKPFGHDLASAQALNEELQRGFDENQIYRIDHFLGKEAVQNILAFRFANGIFEPLWQNRSIDHIQITVAETLGIEHRAGYYDHIGAMRDMIQNHCLELLAHVTMAKPHDMSEQAVRDSRAASLQTFHLEQFVTGQYEGYRHEPDVRPESNTETFAAVKLHIDDPQWHDVPVYIRTGKHLAQKATEISVQFKNPEQNLFPHANANVLTFRIQPDAGIGVSFGVKEADKRELTAHSMTFCFPQPVEKLGDYEQLLLDCLLGDQTFFIRADEIEAAWRFIAPALEAMNNHRPEIYARGQWGPDAAHHLIAADQRHWLLQSFDSCKL